MKHDLFNSSTKSNGLFGSHVNRVRFPVLLSLLLSISIPANAEREAPFSLVVGTQAINATYRLTDQPALLEMANTIKEMGSDTLKVSVSPRYSKAYHIEPNPEIKSARDLVSQEPSFKAAFDMPFRNIMLWLYPFSDSMKSHRTGKMKQGEAERIYREIYDFTAYLLKTYSGTQKSFFIGNWEGDWHALAGQDKKADPQPEILAAMREWFLLREKAVADARRETPHHGVNVYFYVEINQVAKAMREGRPALVNKVLPHIKTDYVSYSSYDVTNVALKLGGDEGRAKLFEALDYIEKHLPESDIPGKRVMIGEYGVTYQSVRNPEIQKQRAAELMGWGLEWGCPFILYWQLYCNEFDQTGDTHRGFWLIDNKGVKQPVWNLHREFLKRAEAYVLDYQRRNGKLPSQAEYCAEAKNWIPPAGAVSPASNLSDSQK
jgi:hypothetical protein